VRWCEGVTREAVAAAARAAPLLRVARLECAASGRVWPVGALRALLLAAPRLTELTADVEVTTVEDAQALLAAAPPFAPLRCRCLRLGPAPTDGAALQPSWAPGAARALADSSLAHGAGAAHLRALNLSGFDNGLPELLHAAAALPGLRQLHLADCVLSLHLLAAPLARLLRGNTLQNLLFCPLFEFSAEAEEQAAGDALADALRACTSLRSLHLANTAPAAGVHALVRACVGHASLASLTLYRLGRCPPAELLEALLAADAPALRTLRVVLCYALTPRALAEADAATRGLLPGLARNTHLRALALAPAPRTREAAALLLHAARAATGLRQLLVSDAGAAAEPPLLPDAAEAVRLVAARPRDDDA
jgi:hypothetical protein